MFPASIQKLIEIFSKFPTIGPRTASRFVFYLLKMSGAEFKELMSAMENVKKSIKTCLLCFDKFEGETELCPLCQNAARDKTIICVVEKETDIQAIEKTKKYKGLYFVLGGTLSAATEEEIKNIKIGGLEERIKNPTRFGIKTEGIKEVIIALNQNSEGEVTTLYLKRKLEPLGIKISRLGRGLPLGGEIEYADEETLEGAFEGRK
jgi:recombination protein RecR